VHFRHHKRSRRIWCLRITDFVLAFTVFPVAVTVIWRGEICLHMNFLYPIWFLLWNNTLKSVIYLRYLAVPGRNPDQHARWREHR